MGVIIFNGKASSDYEIVVEHPPVYTIPKRRVESISVPGRNGNILIDEGVYDNVKREYDIAAGDIWDERFTEIAQSISQWLHSANGGYAVLEDTYEPEYFRMAMYSEEIDIENILMQAGRATISFDCKPQRFLKSGNKISKFPAEYNSLGWKTYDLINTTPYISDPIITIKSTSVVNNQLAPIGSAKIVINNQVYLLTDVPSGTLIIDSSVQDIYDDVGNNMNQYVDLTGATDFPRLHPGKNTMWSETLLTEMEVKPRWWVL